MKIQLHKSAFVILFFVFLIVSGSAFAQQSQVIHLNNRVYHHIKNLQQRGYFSELNPTKLPYTKGEINSSLRNIKEEELSATEAFWYNQVQEEIGFDPSNSEEPYLYGMLEAGLDFNNTLSGNGLRPQSDKIYLLPNIASNLYAGKGGFSAQLGLRHDSFYDYDRLGEIVNSRFGLRSEDYYVGYKNDFFNIYIGKFQNLWAPYGEASTLITDNASSFDRINLSIGPEWFKVSGIFAELDNLGKDGTFSRRDIIESTKNRINGTKRFLALHRIDLKITDGLRLAYFDGFIYSSKNSIASIRYMSLMNFLFFDRNINPLNDEFNALFGGQVWWNYKNLTINLQGMIDDIVIKEGKLESDIEPTTFAITNSLNLSDITDFLDIGYEAELVSYQTYNTDQAEGRYLFLRRGIASQYNDYVYGQLYVRIHAFSLLNGLTLKQAISYLAQGEQEINQDYVDRYPDGEVIDVILTGTEEKTSRFSMNAFYNPDPRFWIDASVGYNYTNDYEHLQGNSNSRLTVE